MCASLSGGTGRTIASLIGGTLRHLLRLLTDLLQRIIRLNIRTLIRRSMGQHARGIKLPGLKQLLFGLPRRMVSRVFTLTLKTRSETRLNISLNLRRISKKNANA